MSKKLRKLFDASQKCVVYFEINVGFGKSSGNYRRRDWIYPTNLNASSVFEVYGVISISTPKVSWAFANTDIYFEINNTFLTGVEKFPELFWHSQNSCQNLTSRQYIYYVMLDNSFSVWWSCVLKVALTSTSWSHNFKSGVKKLFSLFELVCNSSYMDIVTMLIEKGCDVDAKDE